ncbi:putative phosphoglycerate mutase family protein [Aspergillus foveolatus]|uniref:putative phosphoglycerate mutase family protein n=1 Tax=Aspergillus foveolatus TaxID=210207 RepID=UPI003CCE522C
MYSKIISAALLATTYTLAFAKPTVYLIRHGEKPDDGSTGLSAQDEDRAQCLRQVFGVSSGYNIGYIMAMTPKNNGKRNRPYLTVFPLAEDLGLEVDISCDRDDLECVKDVVDNFDGDGNVLICWEHDALMDIVEELGDDDAPERGCSSAWYDLIWTDPFPYDEITAETSEECPG